MADDNDDMPEHVRKEINEAVRIFREDHTRASLSELRDLLTGKTTPAGGGDPPADDGKKPPPKKEPGNDDPPKGGIWWQ